MKKCMFLLVGIFLLPALSLHAQTGCGCAQAANLVNNGDFSAGNTQFSSDLPQVTGCSTGSYDVQAQSRDKCTNTWWTPFLWDNTQGDPTGSYLVVDGDNNQRVWYATLNAPIVQGNPYNFSMWNLRAVSTQPADHIPVLEVRINGHVIGTVNTAGAPMQDWREYCFPWIATFSGTAQLEIWQMPETEGAMDYGIDDIYFGSCDGGTCGADLFVQGTPTGNGCEVQFTGGAGTNAITTILGYSWDFGDGNTSNQQSPTHTYQDPGSYQACMTVTAMTIFGECCSFEWCTNVEVSCQGEPCEAQFSELFPGDPGDGSCLRQLYIPVTANRTILGYYWNFGDGTTGGGSNNVLHTFPGPGTYNVCLTVVMQGANGECCTDTYCKEIYVECSGGGSSGGGGETRIKVDYGQGIGDADADAPDSPGFGLFPNPGNDQLHLLLEDAPASATVSLTNLEGKELMRERLDLSQSGTQSLNTHDLPSGIYFVRVTTDGGTRTQKWVKE